MSLPRLDELPITERDEMVADVWKFLTDRGYDILSPGVLGTRLKEARSQALADAAEIAFNLRLASSMQVAVRLKQLSKRTMSR